MPADRSEPVWTDPRDLVIDGVTIRSVPMPMRPEPSTPTFFGVSKPPRLMHQYVRLCRQLRPERIFELGILFGGSTALLALLARPEKLVAVDVSEERVTALDEMVAAQGLQGTVVTHYGVDQGDTATLTRIADEELGDGPLDLVIDDASHDLARTEASFNVLFPRLRPGGRYVIEDWAWAHEDVGRFRPDDDPLTTIVFEALLAIPSARGFVSHVRVDRDWAVITRRAGAVDPAGYDLRAAADDRGRDLVVPLRS